MIYVSGIIVIELNEFLLYLSRIYTLKKLIFTIYFYFQI